MTESTAAHAPTTPGRTPGGTATTMAVGLVLALVVVVVGNTNLSDGESGGLWPGIVTGVGCAVLAAILYWFVRNRWHGSVRATLVLGILAVLTLAVFWSGAPLVLAGATWAAADGTPAKSRAVLTARVLSALAAVLALVVTFTQ
jgi:hypothetical protein